MVNKHKIIIMTKLALYDKNEGIADRFANDFFRHDYIYRKNLATRLSVGAGGLLLVAVYWLQQIFTAGEDIFTVNIQQYVYDSVLFILVLLAVYSVIGTLQGTREYYLVQKRLEHYLSLVRQLERIDERARKKSEDDRRAILDRESGLDSLPGERRRPRVENKEGPRRPHGANTNRKGNRR